MGGWGAYRTLIELLVNIAIMWQYEVAGEYGQSIMGDAKMKKMLDGNIELSLHLPP